CLRRGQLGMAASIPAAVIVCLVIDHCTRVHAGDGFAILRCCAIIFAVAAVFGVIDIHLFQYVPEVKTPPKPSAGMWRMMVGPLRNRQFLWFGAFVATLTFAVSFMGQFVTLYLIQKIHVTGTGIQLMLLVAPGI